MSSQNIKQLVENLTTTATDERLRNAEIQREKEEVIYREGATAQVFQIKTEKGELYALKVWAKDIASERIRDIEKKYILLHNFLTKERLPYFLPCTFLKEGLKDGENNYLPIVYMPWVKGVSLLKYVNDNISSSEKILALRDKFYEMIENLQMKQVAFGDIHPSNILVQDSGNLILVDYDEIYIPGVGLEEMGIHSVGLRSYRHPCYIKITNLNPHLDSYSAFVLYTALSIVYENAEELQKHTKEGYVLEQIADEIARLANPKNITKHLFFSSEEVKSCLSQVLFLYGQNDVTTLPSFVDSVKKAKKLQPS